MLSDAATINEVRSEAEGLNAPYGAPCFLTQDRPE